LLKNLLDLDLARIKAAYHERTTLARQRAERFAGQRAERFARQIGSSVAHELRNPLNNIMRTSAIGVDHGLVLTVGPGPCAVAIGKASKVYRIHEIGWSSRIHGRRR
jgi:hypothetical protein